MWNDPDEAQKLMRERQHLEKSINTIQSIQNELDDQIGLIELGEEEGDDGVVSEAETALQALHKDLGKRQVDALLSGEMDAANAFVEIHAGAGGTESQDWASMLLRMYTRWAEQNGYKVEVQYVNDGEEAGIKGAAILVRGENAYGWLKTESGVHRLVRISPYDSQARRHTSFSSVWIYPEIDDNVDIEIQDKDIRIDTFRSSGAGGQHINTTDSAVRLTHIPTGIAVACQSERSQHKNRATAWKMLRARLARLEEEKREAEMAGKRGEQGKTGFGSQIRNYFLHPDQRVVDQRTKQRVGSFHAVMDGDIQEFLDAFLRWRVGQDGDPS